MSLMLSHRAALATRMEDVLQAHDSRFTVSQRFQLSAHTSGQAAARRRVYGSPVRYCEVRYTGRPEQIDAMQSRAIVQAFSFDVMVRVQYDDTGESQELFDSVIEGTEPEGVLLSMIDAPRLGPGVVRGSLDNIQVFMTFIDASADLWAHECSFSVTTRER